jgi:hypothetical protein
MPKFPYGGGILRPGGTLWPAAGPWGHFRGVGTAGANRKPIPLRGSRWNPVGRASPPQKIQDALDQVMNLPTVKRFRPHKLLPVNNGR